MMFAMVAAVDGCRLAPMGARAPRGALASGQFGFASASLTWGSRRAPPRRTTLSHGAWFRLSGRWLEEAAIVLELSAAMKAVCLSKIAMTPLNRNRGPHRPR